MKRQITKVRERIDAAAEASGRSGSSVKLVAVSKMHPADAIRKAIKAGQTAFGENKVQEAESKINEIGRDAAEWHYIGHLQTNKAKKAVALFDVIHTVDSPELIHKLEAACTDIGREHLSIFVQVDLAGEETKSGISEQQLPMLIESLKRAKHLRFDGLMLLPPYFDDAEMTRPYFARLREIRDRLLDEGCFSNGRGELSMGMSHDLEVAIAEGATVVRVGTAVFGERVKAV